MKIVVILLFMKKIEIKIILIYLKYKFINYKVKSIMGAAYIIPERKQDEFMKNVNFYMTGFFRQSTHFTWKNIEYLYNCNYGWSYWKISFNEKNYVFNYNIETDEIVINHHSNCNQSAVSCVEYDCSVVCETCIHHFCDGKKFGICYHGTFNVNDETCIDNTSIGVIGTKVLAE